MNDLNIPPDRESWQNKICRLATDLLIPVIMPVSTALVVWLGNRKSSKPSDNSGEHCKHEEQMLDLKTRHEAQASYLKKRHDYEQQVSVEEEKELQKILLDIEQVQNVLRQRQDVYCSNFKSKEGRKEREKWLLDFAYQKHYEKDLSFFIGMQKVLDEKTGDRHCGNNYHENGCLMWEWLDGIRAKAHLRKCQRVYTKVCDWESKNKY
ncbi:coiled-coil domain-containing protein 127-like [Ptychodera flava]|uniref:coiled-coil domain-containing protein 127-like n=1 Tax=Ptychodera flava TaxID=63121 RepID=UPI003969EE70